MVYRPCTSLTCNNTANVAFCQKEVKGLNSYACGNFDRFVVKEHAHGLSLEFTSVLSPKKTQIDFLCDPEFTGVGRMIPGPNGGEPELNFYHFQWKTTYACPTNSSSNSGGNSF